MIIWKFIAILQQFLDANGAIADLPDDNNNIALFKFKTKIGNDGKTNLQIMVSLKYLICFWRTLKRSSIN